MRELWQITWEVLIVMYSAYHIQEPDKNINISYLLFSIHYIVILSFIYVGSGGPGMLDRQGSMTFVIFCGINFYMRGSWMYCTYIEHMYKQGKYEFHSPFLTLWYCLHADVFTLVLISQYLILYGQLLQIDYFDLIMTL